MANNINAQKPFNFIMNIILVELVDYSQLPLSSISQYNSAWLSYVTGFSYRPRPLYRLCTEVTPLCVSIGKIHVHQIKKKG